MKKLYKDVEKYYTKKIKKFGPTPKGVDWNGEKSQLIRFRKLAKILTSKISSLNDIGCGYGKFSEYINNNYKNIEYRGYDISRTMIDEAIKLYPHQKFFKISNLNKIQIADFSIASGIFNVRLNFTKSEWLSYIFSTLNELNSKSKKGFSFNILTKNCDKEYMKKKLYYADPLVLLNYCKVNFSNNVVLIDDYKLYEFTILVKKE